MRDRFRRAGLDAPEQQARLLAGLALGCDGLALFTREGETAPPDALARLEDFATRRLEGEPVDRIAGEKTFRGLDFRLGPDTLAPRPETEMLVERGMALLEGLERPRILDLGTGTGCIAIALLCALPSAQAVAVDLSAGAIGIAQENARRHGVADRIAFRVGSWFEPVGEDEVFDLVVSNPPYVQSGVVAGLAREVREHDPVLALDGGTDGLDAYRALAAGLGGHLAPRGTALFEIGYDQGRSVPPVFAAAGLVPVAVEADLAGLDRMVVVRHIEGEGGAPRDGGASAF